MSPNKSPRILRTTFGMLCVIGAGLSVAIIFLVLMSGFPGMPRLARGNVVGYERELTGQSMGSLRYFPLVEYTDATGERHSFRSWSGQIKPSYTNGAAIHVVYSLSENPKLRRSEILSSSSQLAMWSWLPWALSIAAFVGIIPLTASAYIQLNKRGITTPTILLCTCSLLLSGCLSQKNKNILGFAITERVFGGLMDIPFWTDAFKESKGRLPRDYPELCRFVTQQTDSRFEMARWDQVDFSLLPTGQRQAILYAISNDQTNRCYITWGKPKETPHAQ